MQPRFCQPFSKTVRKMRKPAFGVGGYVTAHGASVCGNEKTIFLAGPDFTIYLGLMLEEGTAISLTLKSNILNMKKALLIFVLLLLAKFASAQTVTGKVAAQADGAPIPGVSVVLKGTTEGTTTDANGEYTIRLTTSDPVLVFSFIGFSTQEIEAAGRT